MAQATLSRIVVERHGRRRDQEVDLRRTLHQLRWGRDLAFATACSNRKPASNNWTTASRGDGRGIDRQAFAARQRSGAAARLTVVAVRPRWSAASQTVAPKLKGHVELFDKIDEPWSADSGFRWVSFNLDGKYCYPSDGSVIDCDLGKKTAIKIAPNSAPGAASGTCETALDD